MISATFIFLSRVVKKCSTTVYSIPVLILHLCIVFMCKVDPHLHSRYLFFILQNVKSVCTVNSLFSANSLTIITKKRSNITFGTFKVFIREGVERVWYNPFDNTETVNYTADAFLSWNVIEITSILLRFRWLAFLKYMFVYLCLYIPTSVMINWVWL